MTASPYGSKRLNKSNVRSYCQNLLLNYLAMKACGKTVCQLPGIPSFHFISFIWLYILTWTKLVSLFTSGAFILAKARRHALSRKRLCICVTQQYNALIPYQMTGEVNVDSSVSRLHLLNLKLKQLRTHSEAP